MAKNKSTASKKPRMTVSQLRDKVEKTSPYFFDKKTMKFFGDTMSNYSVVYTQLNDIPVWELRRKKETPKGFFKSAYFDAETFRRVFP